MATSLNLVHRVDLKTLFTCLRNHPKARFALSADGEIARIRPPSVLLRKHYRKHGVPNVAAFESDVVPIRIAENPVTLSLTQVKSVTLVML